MHLESSTDPTDHESNAELAVRSVPEPDPNLALFKTIFDTAVHSIIAIDDSGTIILASSAVKDFLGYSPEDLIGEPIEVLLMPERRARHAALIRQFFESPRDRSMTAGMELTARHRDGTPRAVDISLRHFAVAGRFVAVAEVQSAIERRGSESAALLASLFESVDFFMTATNPMGLITVWNSAAERIFGYTADEVIGRHYNFLVPPEARASQNEAHARTLHEGISTRYETQLIRKDGTLVDIGATRSPIRDQEGVIIGTTRIGRDITQQLVIAREREVLERRVNQIHRLESLGQLAGGVAHEFNNLLFLISTYAGFAKEKLVEMPETHADFEKIEIAASQAKALTRRLLMFAHQEIAELRTFAVNEQLVHVAELLGQTLGEDIELVVRPLANHDSVLADPGQIEQVILNVVLNSRYAMPDGGVVTIETNDVTIDSTDVVEHPTLREGRHVLLEISDTGSGMDSTSLERIFEPFFTTKPSGEGTGLGMSMAFGVIELAGGDIRFDSELGVGTTCRILLPLSEGVAPIETASPVVSVQGRGETILVVEDMVDIRELFERILRSSGYHVLAPASSPEAIALLETNEAAIDLLLTDVIMPEKSGRAVADAFKVTRPQSPVLFISGYADPAVLSDLEYEYTFLHKPVSKSDLLVTIRNLLEEASMVDPEPA